MIGEAIFAIASLAVVLAKCNNPPKPPEPINKVVCYYDTAGNFRSGQAQFNDSHLLGALQNCTHLIYGFAAIHPTTYELIPLSQQFDLIQNHYRNVTNKTCQFPHLRVLLSVGGNSDDPEDSQKYLKLLECNATRRAFVQSAGALLSSNCFHGLDLAWQFPPNKQKKIYSHWNRGRMKHNYVSPTEIDSKHAEHKKQFTALVHELKSELVVKQRLMLSLTVLPNVNSSIYYDIPVLEPDLHFINLLAFDQYTPERNPNEANYTAPLYQPTNGTCNENANALVQLWISKGCPKNKLVLGIPTFANTWKTCNDPGSSGVKPIFKFNGSGEAGPHTKEKGLLSYHEICSQLSNPNRLRSPLRSVEDSTGKFGHYAFKLPDKHGNPGIWAYYEDPYTAKNKTIYARSNGLGGIAIFDLTMDDFGGLCTGNKYPILRAATLP